MSREGNEGRSAADRRRSSAAVQAALAQPSARQLSRRAREQLQQRVILAAVGMVGLLVLLIIGGGTYRELLGFPNEAVAVVDGEPIRLRTYTDALAEEMRSLQGQVAAGSRDQQNPGQVSGNVQKLISAQETLPEDVLEKQIEDAVIRREAVRRGINIPTQDLEGKINEFLSTQRELLNQPTPTATETATPRPSPTLTPEGFVAPPTATPTETRDPLTPSPTHTPSPTLDPDVPTPTRTPFPTRLTATAVVTPTVPNTFEPADYEKAYQVLKSQLRNEDNFRRGIELQLLRERLRAAVGANVPTSGPRAHVFRLATSTPDEGKVALIQLLCFDYPIEELVAQASERPIEGRTSGDLGWVAKGAEAREFDDVVFSPDTPLNEWIGRGKSEQGCPTAEDPPPPVPLEARIPNPFAAGNHYEIVKVVAREEFALYDQKNLEKMKDRAFKEWLEAAKQSPEVRRELSAQERQWAVDRASKGIIETTTDRRRR